MSGRGMKVALVLVAAVATGAVFAVTVAGQDPAVVNKQTITVKFENDRVRVLEANIPPGAREQPHAHPASVLYVVEGGTMRNHAADGTTSETTYTSGQTVYRDPLTHWAENIGKTNVRIAIVELKK